MTQRAWVSITQFRHRPREIELTWLLCRVCTNNTFYNLGLFTLHVSKQPNLSGLSLYTLFIRVSSDLWFSQFGFPRFGCPVIRSCRPDQFFALSKETKKKKRKEITNRVWILTQVVLNGKDDLKIVVWSGTKKISIKTIFPFKQIV